MLKEYTQNKKFIVIEFEIDNLKINIERLSGNDIWNMNIPCVKFISSTWNDDFDSYDYFLDFNHKIKSKKNKYIVVNNFLEELKRHIAKLIVSNLDYLDYIQEYDPDEIKMIVFCRKRKKYLKGLIIKINNFQKKLPK